MIYDSCRKEDPYPANVNSQDISTPAASIDVPKENYVPSGGPQKEVTVTWRQLSVRVPAPEAVNGDTLWSEIDPREFIRKFKKPMKMVCSAIIDLKKHAYGP